MGHIRNTTGALLAMLALTAGCTNDNDFLEQTNIDDWAQAPNNQVDILWVIDDSNSMSEEQDTLAAGFESFAQQLDDSGTVFQIGVITTSFDESDSSRGVLIGDPPFLTNEDDYLNLFKERALVGIGGSDKEKGLEAATFALHPTMTLAGGPNEGFLRPEAQLLVVFVSDEEDCSDKGSLTGEPATACYTDIDKLEPTSTYVQDLRDLKSDKDLVQVSAIVGLQSSTCADVWPGMRYLETAAYTGGIAGDICQADWSSMMTELGLNAVGIRASFRLSKAAQPDTLIVYVDGEEVAESPTNGWTYDETTWYLTFNGASIPERGATISAEYTVQPGVSEPAGTTSGT